jgi:ribosomal-protein-alanine N-acetyltransferase
MSAEPFLLEWASEADLDAILEIERASFSHPWSERGFRAEMADRPSGGVLALRAPYAASDPGRGILAYCVFRVAADEMHVHDLAVHPARRSRGLGRKLMLLAIGAAARRGARKAILEVRAGNQAAIALYRSLGFQPVLRRRDYYERPREDALVLQHPDLIGVAKRLPPA